MSNFLMSSDELVPITFSGSLSFLFLALSLFFFGISYILFSSPTYTPIFLPQEKE